MVKQTLYENIFGLQIARKEVIERIKKEPLVYQKFLTFDVSD